MKNQYTTKLLALMSIFILLSLIALPMAAPPASATTGSLLDMGIITTSAVTGAAIGAGIGDGPGAAVGALVGALFGFLVTYTGSDDPGNTWNNPQHFWAREKATDMRDLFNISNAQAQNLITSLQGMTNFFVRKADYGARLLYDYQTNNGLSHTFDPEFVLSQSWVYNATQSQLWAVIETYNQIFSAYDDFAASLVGTYSGMSWGLYAPTADADGIASSGTEPLVIRMNCKVSTAAGQYVVLNPAEPLLLHQAPFSAVNTVNLQLYDTHGIKVLDENYTGANSDVIVVDLAAKGIPLGSYNIVKTAKWDLTGLAVPAAVSPGAVVPQISVYKRVSALNETLSWQSDLIMTATGNPGTFFARYQATEAGDNNYRQCSVEPQIRFLVTTWASAKTNESVPFTYNLYSESKPGMFELIKDLIADTASMYTTVISFAQTTFNLIKNSGGAYSPPPADIIFADPNQMVNLTWEQIYIMYMAYMSQAAGWFYNNSQMLVQDINFSAESMNLVIRAEIRDANGTQICDNSTVMTPFVALKNMTLITWDWTDFNQTAFVMIWGNTSEMPPHWPLWAEGEHEDVTNDFNISSCEYLVVHPGWEIRPWNMLYKGGNVATINLTVTRLNYVIGNTTSTGTPPQNLGDWQWILEHWYYIGMIAGVALVLAAIWARSWLIGVAGLAALLISVAAYLWANWGDIYAWFNPFALIRSQVSDWWWN